MLVVDMQRGFVDAGEAMEVPAARACVPIIRGLLEDFRAARLPVDFTAFVYRRTFRCWSVSCIPSTSPRRRAPHEASGCRRPVAWPARRAPASSTRWHRGPMSP
ncbi:MAG TPA: isochorismatase family protein [Caldimonas sp.]|nr:isochorismatase family protein [Caldimonas sp.]